MTTRLFLGVGASILDAGASILDAGASFLDVSVVRWFVCLRAGLPGRHS